MSYFFGNLPLAHQNKHSSADKECAGESGRLQWTAVTQAQPPGVKLAAHSWRGHGAPHGAGPLRFSNTFVNSHCALPAELPSISSPAAAPRDGRLGNCREPWAVPAHEARCAAAAAHTELASSLSARRKALMTQVGCARDLDLRVLQQAVNAYDADVQVCLL